MTTLPIACTLGPAALKARRAGLLADLVRRADGRHEIEDGHRLVFAATGDIVQSIARTVDAERQCCRFVQFTLTVSPDEGPITLEFTGPPGTREFMAALMEP